MDQQCAKRADTFALGDVGLNIAEWCHVTVLPEAVLRMKSHVKRLRLYGSHIQRIPAWIKQLTMLEEIDPYTSYGLHWFPFEIVHCEKLRSSRVSTRAYYGNEKNALGYPQLDSDPSPNGMKRLFPLQYLAARVCEAHNIPLPPYATDVLAAQRDAECSVCFKRYVSVESYTYWITRHLASHDVVPMLVHACSLHCVETLKWFKPPTKESWWYRVSPHKGKIDLKRRL